MLDATIRLHDVSGRIDHIALDPHRNRLIVAELGNDTVDVVDLSTGKLVGRIRGLREPQGVGYSEKADRIVVANAGDGSVRFYGAQTLEPAGEVSLGDDADNVRVDPRTGSLVVGYGSGALAIIDPVSRTRVADIKLRAHPESFQIAAATGMAFINVPDARQIDVVNLDSRQLVATWRLSGNANFPMALDPTQKVMATVFRAPAQLALIDVSTGEVVVRQPSCGDADDVFFDARRARIYVSCGSGEIATFERDPTGYRPLAPTQTATGARTSLFVPELDRLFVARRAGLLESEAALLVYRPVP